MHNKIADQLEGVALAALLLPPVDPTTPTEDLALAQARIQHARANAALRTAFAARREATKAGTAGAPKPTGVRMVGSNGIALDVYDDGSHRKEWKRHPDLSGRQFRKLRKQANRSWRAQQRAAQETHAQQHSDPVSTEEALPSVREPGE